ncbi:cation diffusion facilitator family transporter [Pontibacter ramchanderi]|uniref:Cobalt-zinc-cadmium efflux system protein n=1 Tax=Pontibacter ramchanderi TaxID=1179743 RepID=A0A2N3V3Q3_9BACT|nr:cation diffusion facilitator family transporter [Pontibacter ramchanderi]PKV76247.1 cobalt-zinc-cadmium efflux system protein [Pontibacter ramchanderi]
MAHDHHQHEGHGHHHHHGGDNIKVAFFLNLSFTVIEVFGGLWINSMAILSDALHDLGDSLSLGLAWYFERLSRKGSDQQFSYGYKRFSLLGAVINSVVLLLGSGIVLWVSVPRLFNPEPVHAPGMIGFAILGVLVNGAAAFRLNKGESLNERVAMLHLLEDVLGWAAVLVGGILLYFFDWPIIDPLLSVLITGFILYNVVRNLRKGLQILLQGTPANISLQEVRRRLELLPEVRSVHDLHLWTLDGLSHVLTLHAVVGNNLNLEEAHEVKQRIRGAMQDAQIDHVTVELEMPGQECSQEHCTPDLPSSD